ncbi:MAG TPA: hypothetical protein PKJ47_12520 [Candidatus Limiplasma sp.]|nr:hypothetical protein [Candidatus Limiplasma sp.]
MYRIEITGATLEEIIAQLHAWEQVTNHPASAQAQPPMAPQYAALVPSPIPQIAPAPVQVPPAPQYAAPAQPIPTAAPTFNANDLMTAGAQLMARVGVPAMQQLLARFGVQGINQVPPERYGEFAQALRDMGGTI